MKKNLNILLALLLMFTLVACTERQVPEETIVETPAETEKETTQEETGLTIPEDGTYTGKAKGFSGDVEVEVVVSGGKISEVKVVKESETPEIGGAAKDTASQQIVEANSLEIDGVAGATVTVDAIKAAVKDALSGSGSSEEEASQEEAGLTIPEDGTYTGKAKGFSGDVEVEVVVSGGKISEVKVVKESETPEIGGAAKDTASQQIVEANSLEIDGVAGATVTVDAIKAAVKDALSQ
nr:FMN-binding protein [Helcococcus sueciensis]